jgi:hypothetical protein
LIEVRLVKDHQPINQHHCFATMICQYRTQSTEMKDMRSSVKNTILSIYASHQFGKS